MVESFFFMSLGISFFLIFLMVYHFKNRIDSLEKNNDSLADICHSVIAEIDSMKTRISILSIKKEECRPSVKARPEIFAQDVSFVIQEPLVIDLEAEDTDVEIRDVETNDDLVSELETDGTKKKKSKYAKMNLSALRALCLAQGYSNADLWKWRKSELVHWLEEYKNE